MSGYAAATRPRSFSASRSDETRATVGRREASDGYKVVFAPAELDAGFTDKVVILAYDKDGKPLDQAEGPFRLIAVGEKRPARWVRGVVKIRDEAPASRP